MDIFAFDASLYGVAGVTPAKNSFKLALDGRTYNAMRSVTFPDHKVERTVITSAGGDGVVAVTDGVLNADGEGNFKLLPASGTLFLRTLRAKSPGTSHLKIPFSLIAYAIDPVTLVQTVTKESRVCYLTQIKFDDVGEGGEAVGTTFTFKSLSEALDGLMIAE